MIKKIYIALISFSFAALTCISCSNWLDLYPANEIKEEYLFSSGDGFRTALNGIYRKMTTFDLYGSNLTWGLVDAWGQVYYMAQSPDLGGGKAMKKIAEFNFENSELLPTTNAMWDAAWNVVANCNELVQQVAVADPDIFYRQEQEKQMIWGEALGLRAFMQFDLLRIYAPAPSSVNYGEDSRTFIPYVNVYPSYVNAHQTVSYCLEQIIADLTEAQKILYEVDKHASMSPSERFGSIGSGEILFLGYRGFRLNYYAVTAILARVYLYAGKKEEAYLEAKKLIDEEKSTRYFRASTSKYDITDYGNMKMYNDVIWGLYSPTELVEWDREINRTTENFCLCLDSDVASSLFGNESSSDWRFIYQLEPFYYNYYYRTLKYKEQLTTSRYGVVNNQMIPLIRMSEVYYIAAEAIFDANPEEAHSYLALVKQGRGIRNVDYSTVLNKEAFINLLENDMRREFIGEGQTLYMYKRLNHPIKSGTYGVDDVMPTDDYVVLPQPDSEKNIY